MTAAVFESKLHALLADHFPFAVLPNVRLFRPSYVERRYGFEMDNILHISFEGSDYIIVIEAKNQPVKEVKGEWQVQYQGGPKCARRQLGNHIATLREYVEPLARHVDLRFLGIVVSSSEETASRDLTINDSEQYCCRHFSKLLELLEQRFNLRKKPERGVPEVFRLSQSSFLELFRLGVPLPLLGHPEIQSAIRYIERCRRNLDESIFQHFSPTPRRWAINGSAGMGKSVLLGYAACVLACGSEMEFNDGKPRLRSAVNRFTGMHFNPARGSLGVFAMTQRQLDNLRFWFEHFSTIFKSLDESDARQLRFGRPEFHLCREMRELEAKPWSAVLLDEAHDIQENTAKRLVFRHKKDGFYLILACDRHQKLRLAGEDARILEGLDFTSHTRRLRQIYRNASPVYIASLALMFRWFADSGPKIVPTKEELEGAFGFNITGTMDEGYLLSLLNDAHPANSWSHTVASFPSATAAYLCLSQTKLGHKDVLWVRFSGENHDFDYEKLSAFTYHNFRTEEAENLTDKYIKGQDFPVVVIEGFPSFMDRYQSGDGSPGSAELHEKKMWKFRRELYLCASRATCFLYFICTNSGTPEADNIRRELAKLTDVLGRPDPNDGQGGRTWRVKLDKVTDLERRKLTVFTDASLTNPQTQEESFAPPGHSTEAATAPSSEAPDPRISPTVTPAPAPVVTQVPDAASWVQEQRRPHLPSANPIPSAQDSLAAQESVVESAPVYVLNGPATVKDVARRLELRPFNVISDLIGLRVFVSNADKNIDVHVQRQLAKKHGFRVRLPTEAEQLEQKLNELQQQFTRA